MPILPVEEAVAEEAAAEEATEEVAPDTEAKEEDELEMAVAETDALAIGAVALASIEEAAGETLSTGYMGFVKKKLFNITFFLKKNLHKGSSYRHRMAFQYRDYHNPIQID